MTESTAGEADPAGKRLPAELRMRAIAAGLRAAGLTARLRHSKAGWEITVIQLRPPHRETEVVIDDGDYVEIRYWNPAGSTPAQVTSRIVAALAAVNDPAGDRR